MRIPKAWVPLITKRIIADLLAKGLVAARVSVEELIAGSEKLLLDELMVEDKINDEVREILKKYSAEIEKGRLDYRTIFELTKKKLVKERGAIL